MNENKKEKLKNLIKRLHEGEDPEKIKQEFSQLTKNLTPYEISVAEGELVKEGLPREELTKFCDVHLAVFKESIEKEEDIAPPGHPINILMQEHKKVLDFADKLRETTKKISTLEKYDKENEDIKELIHIIKHFKESESHYLREENILFPYLEKHGITEPPAVMWSEHDKIRAVEKELYETIDNPQIIEYSKLTEKLKNLSITLSDLLSNHFYKENKILYPTSLRVIEENEWSTIREEFDRIGYCCFTPKPPEIKPKTKPKEEKITLPDKTIDLETGTLTFEEVKGILNTLPVEVTFVDKDDIVKYFIPSKEMTFLRTKAVIGRKVQNCHPKKSLHVVNKILNDFREGKRESADFWINFKGRYVLIRYFPVRNEKGEYIGCLEVTQDITDIKKLEGEKRLLD